MGFLKEGGKKKRPMLKAFSIGFVDDLIVS
jgi:hypothetical protein